MLNLFQHPTCKACLVLSPTCEIPKLIRNDIYSDYY